MTFAAFIRDLRNEDGSGRTITPEGVCAPASDGGDMRLDWYSEWHWEPGQHGQEGARQTLFRGAVAPFAVAMAPAVADLDAPPAEQAGIDGPGAWPKQRKRGGERCE